MYLSVIFHDEERQTLVDKLHAKGFNVFGGAKDSSNIIAYKYIMSDPKEARDYLDQVEKSVEKLNDPKLAGRFSPLHYNLFNGCLRRTPDRLPERKIHSLLCKQLESTFRDEQSTY